MHRRLLFLAAALAAATFPAPMPANAATQTPFSHKAYGTALESGKPILIAVHASWCPVCAKQAPIIDELGQRPEFKDLVILTADFDAQKDVLTALGVTMQATLIVLHGTAERGRAVGITDRDAILALMLKSRS